VRDNAILRSLKRRLNRLFSAKAPEQALPPEWFDADWYLSQYPDVAAAGMDPWGHYSRFGKAEGRLPAPNRALAMGHALWRGAEDVMLPRLHRLVASPDASLHEQQQARWELARWYAWQKDWARVVKTLAPPHTLPPLPQNPAGPFLLLTEALCRLLMQAGGEPPDHWAVPLRHTLEQLETRAGEQADVVLAKANARLALDGHGSDLQRLTLLNGLFERHALQPLRLQDDSRPLYLDNLAAGSSESRATPDGTTDKSRPLVSVIVPVYNAANTLPTVLRSLYAQTWPNLELLLVDDASTDDSVAVIEAMQPECPGHIHQKLIRHEENQGAYAARNTALALAEGEFITVHDSDDWSHPQKLEKQALALMGAGGVSEVQAMACLSWWVRVADELLFHHWHLENYGWVYPNMSSLMFRREVVAQLGFWDQVRVNADTEYRERIEAAFGAGAVIEVLPDVALSFGRADEGSLSQHSQTHLITQFVGVRNDYMQAARAWHARAEESADLYLASTPENRPFMAPAELLRDGQANVATSSPKDAVRLSGWFDAGWYLQRYIALQKGLMEPFEHFWCSAAEHGYDPGPDFSSSGYMRLCPEATEAENPLAHYCQSPDASKALPVWPGAKYCAGQPTVMLCGHQAGPRLFGAERSLLDVLSALSRLGFNVLVTLPEALNQAYEQQILQECAALAVLPYGWWQEGRRPVAATVRHFSRLIERFDVVAVHANTAVLDEPLRAARQKGIPAMVHVRELPAADPDLCDALGSDAAGIFQHAALLADLLIANSRHTQGTIRQALAHSDHEQTPVAVVPNTLAMAPLLAIPEPSRQLSQGPLRVGMLSSNLPKKGLADAEALASRLKDAKAPVEIVLNGPETEALQALLERQARGKLPANIVYRGYVPNPADALAELEVVLNLSRFQESFGRTVLEAMAAARPVVAYDWGALSELVVPGETGYLVEQGDVDAVAGYVEKLAGSAELRCDLGVAARARAEGCFGASAMEQALSQAYESLKVVAVSGRA